MAKIEFINKPLVQSTTDINWSIEKYTGLNTFTAPFKSFSFYCVSNDCTVNGEAVPETFSAEIAVGEGEQLIGDLVLTGTEYYVNFTKV